MSSLPFSVAQLYLPAPTTLEQAVAAQKSSMIVWQAKGEGDDESRVDPSVDHSVEGGGAERGVARMAVLGDDEFTSAAPAGAEPTPKRIETLRERSRGNRKFEDRYRLTVLEPYVMKEAATIELKQEQRMPHFADELERVLIAMMVEQDLYRSGLNTDLHILRKVRSSKQRGEAKRSKFAIDHLRKLLPAFDTIRTITLSDREMRIYISNMFDQPKVVGDLENHGFTTTAGTDRMGRTLITATAPDGGSFQIGTIFVKLDLTDEDSLDTNLTRFIEFIATKRFKLGWFKVAPLVNLHREIYPLVKLMFGDEYPRNTLSNALGVLTDTLSKDVDLDETDLLVETQASRMKRAKGIRHGDNRTFRVDGFEADHVDFMTVTEGEEPVITIKFDCEIDVETLKNLLDGLSGPRLFLTSPKRRMRRDVRFVHKGGGGVTVRRNKSYFDEYRILDEEGQSVLSFSSQEGKSILFVKPSNGDIDDAMRVANLIYDERIFITTALRTKEISYSGLNELEKHVLEAFRQLTRIYRFFLLHEDQRKTVEVAMETGAVVEPLTAEQWVIRVMGEAAKGADFSQMVMHVLTVMDSRINPNMFAMLGREEETQENARQIYGELQQLKGRFEAVTAKY